MNAETPILGRNEKLSEHVLTYAIAVASVIQSTTSLISDITPCTRLLAAIEL
jgi:hypothetical protein